jgi:hypothetical protein
MELGPGAEIMQEVRGLDPDTWYEFAGFLRVDRGERAIIGVREFGGEETYSPSVTRNSPNWYRCIVHFKTGRSSTSAKVFVRRTTKGDGRVFADDFGLIHVRKN